MCRATSLVASVCCTLFTETGWHHAFEAAFEAAVDIRSNYSIRLAYQTILYTYPTRGALTTLFVAGSNDTLTRFVR